MGTTYPPDGVEVVAASGTWGVDFDQNTALTNVMGPTCIEFKNTTGTNTALISDYYPMETSAGVGFDSTPYIVEFIVQADAVSVPNLNVLTLQLHTYNASKVTAGTNAVWNNVLPAANTWYKIRAIYWGGQLSNYARWSVTKNSTNAWTAYLDAVTIRPYPRSFSAYSDSATSIGSGWTKVEFNIENYDYGGLYSHTSDRFTAYADGLYHFDTHIAFDTGLASGEQVALAFYVNGAVSRRLSTDKTPALNFTHELNGSADIELSRGDYVEVYAYTQTNSVNTYVASSEFTWFNGREIR